MVSWSEGSSSFWNDESVTSELPRTIPCYEWSGIANELSYRCLHLEPCLRQVAFQSSDTDRRFLACAKEKAEEKCCYLEWIDREWSVAMQFCIADKEEAINQIGTARFAISDLKEEIEKKKLADHFCTTLHQVLRAKAEKERD
ncbi:secologanin synthase [Hordeum vulgare]|nr:secologanin synthase [Hordeum vulgare]